MYPTYPTTDLTDLLCKELGIKKSKHPLDGGTHVSRLLGTKDNLEAAISEVRFNKPKAILEFVACRVLNPGDYETHIRFKVRGIFDESN